MDAGAAKAWGYEDAVSDELYERVKETVWTPPCHGDDIIYVRETWNYGYFDTEYRECSPSECWFEPMDLECKGVEYMKDACVFVYRADFTPQEEMSFASEDSNGKMRFPWRPAIHMPKAAARIFLKVKRVSVERLRDICLGDVEAEGVKGGRDQFIHFANLWDSTVDTRNERNQWQTWAWNPWVWKIEFERLEGGGSNTD